MTTAVGNSPSTTGTGSTGGSSSSTSAAATQDKFLNLLVAQLKNQDPLSPMDNAQVTSQLAQINTVQGIESLNTTLQTLMGSYSTSQSMQAASMVGRYIFTDGNKMNLADGAAVAGVTLDSPADKVTITVTSPSGQVVHTATMDNLDAGTNTFQWDGKTDSGAASAAGQYTFAITATNQGQKVTSTPLAVSMVDSVINNASGPLLHTSTGSVTWDKVKQVM
jgi:flagellar basal-body rod modification protein FlgD